MGLISILAESVLAVPQLDLDQNKFIKENAERLEQLENRLRIQEKKIKQYEMQIKRLEFENKKIKSDYSPAKEQGESAAPQKTKKIIYLEAQIAEIEKAIAGGLSRDIVADKLESYKTRLSEAYAEMESESSSDKGEAETAQSPLTTVSGAIDVEAASTSGYDKTKESSLAAANVFIQVAREFEEGLTATISLLYEQGDTDLEVDEAKFELVRDNGFWLYGGQSYIAFGRYQTNFVSDPLTLEIGETRKTVMGVGYQAPFGLSLGYGAFKGDLRQADADSKVKDFVAHVEYGFEKNGFSFSVASSHLSNFYETDGVGGYFVESFAEQDSDFEQKVPASAIDLAFGFRGFGIFYESVTALKAAKQTEIPWMSGEDGAKVSATSLEVFYGWEYRGLGGSFQLSQQSTNQAVSLGLPKMRSLVGFAQNLTPNLVMGVEYFVDQDYAASDCGGEVCGSEEKATGSVINFGLEF